MSEGLRINEVFAYVLVDEDGDEGVPAVGLGSMWYPMMGADRERMADFRRHAQEIAKAKGRAVRLVRFTTRETLETLDP